MKIYKIIWFSQMTHTLLPVLYEPYDIAHILCFLRNIGKYYRKSYLKQFNNFSNEIKNYFCGDLWPFLVKVIIR